MRYSINELLDACHYYFKETNRRMTFEYSLVAGVNDQPVHAQELASRLKGFPCHVNLIPVNPIKERDFKQSMPCLLYTSDLIQDRLDKGEQIMLFLNRRGYAGFVSCRSCGHVMECPHCDISMTYHSCLLYTSSSLKKTC